MKMSLSFADVQRVKKGGVLARLLETLFITLIKITGRNSVEVFKLKGK